MPGGEGRLVSDLDMDLDRRIAFGGDEKGILASYA